MLMKGGSYRISRSYRLYKVIAEKEYTRSRGASSELNNQDFGMSFPGNHLNSYPGSGEWPPCFDFLLRTCVFQFLYSIKAYRSEDRCLVLGGPDAVVALVLQ